MKVLVVWSCIPPTNSDRKEIINSLSWALEKKIIQDIIFIRSWQKDYLQVVDLSKETLETLSKDDFFVKDDE